MQTINNGEQVKELMSTFFNINVDEVLSETARDAAIRKMGVYQQENEVGRAQLYAIEVTEHENLKREIMRFSQEFIVSVRTIQMFEHVPAAYKRETMRFFSSHFPSFDKNAANSLGKHFKSSLEYVKSIPGATLEKGKFAHLSNLVMSKLIEKSRNSFFKRVKTDSKLRDQFKKRLDTYCEVTWAMVMQEEGTFHSDSPIAEKVANRNRVAKDQVEHFLNDKCRVNTRAKTESDKFYKAYETWVIDKSYEILGKKTFLEEVFKLVPIAKHSMENGKTYVDGLKVSA